ncbi:hypothetical protein XENTR_v10010146 [Xenopus tropicalis]|uniref:C-X-C motif chemokine 16 n=1 Tax=Xenopus tropicalis TaxID=8364 RepID=A0A8J0QRP1_XENTR|nr:uncharacterized protein LOC100490837 isoform X1 [Xenopus tropicalis]KAE8620199.1 hypothetical protein XENTR_v10010146 [Xenopus tropicalis]
MKFPARMWIRLLLVCLLSVHSAVAQFGANAGACCFDMKPRDPPTDALFRLYKEKVKGFEECPHYRVQFKFDKGKICASKHDAWVEKLICHLKKDSYFCAKHGDSGSRPDFSKDSKKVPTTIPPAPDVAGDSKKPPGPAVTQRAPNANTQKATTAPSGTEAAPTEQAAVPGDYPVTPTQYSAVAKEQDKERLENPETIDKETGVSSSMKTAIISLVFISLFLVALVAFLICRRRRKPESGTGEEIKDLTPKGQQETVQTNSQKSFA